MEDVGRKAQVKNLCVSKEVSKEVSSSKEKGRKRENFVVGRLSSHLLA
jgi:hypothetical protein